MYSTSTIWWTGLLRKAGGPGHIRRSGSGERGPLIKKSHVQPSEMINVNIGPQDLEGALFGPDSVLEFSLK
jgi:hypothetical protein